MESSTITGHAPPFPTATEAHSSYNYRTYCVGGAVPIVIGSVVLIACTILSSGNREGFFQSLPVQISVITIGFGVVFEGVALHYFIKSRVQQNQGV